MNKIKGKGKRKQYNIPYNIKAIGKNIKWGTGGGYEICFGKTLYTPGLLFNQAFQFWRKNYVKFNLGIGEGKNTLL